MSITRLHWIATLSTTTTHPTRYFWEPCPQDKFSYVLIDRVSKREVARVTYLTTVRKWRWSRNTTRLLHGADPAEGIVRLLTEAQKLVEEGLPKEM